jgi:transcriptional regulator with XRE-family HTH domain
MHGTIKSALRDSGLVSHVHGAAAFRDMLRRAVIYDRRFTIDQLADLSGVKARTIASYMETGRDVEPSISTALSLLCVLGNPYFAEFLRSTIGYSPIAHDEAEANAIVTLVPDGMKHFAVIAEVVADGRIDHVEAPHFERACDGMVGTFVGHSSVARAV